MRAHRCALYHEEKAKGCQVIAPAKGTVMMLREGEVAEQQAAPVTQGNRSRRGQGWIWLLVAGQIRQVLGNTFFHSQCKSFHSWSFLEWSWVWGMATRHQSCGDMSITGDVHEHPAHSCSLQHNLAPTVWRASTKPIPSLLGSAAWKHDGEARVAALFLGSAKHRQCVSTPSASYGRSVPADLATCLASRCRGRPSFRAHTFTASKQMHTCWCLQNLFNSPCQGSPQRAKPLSEL